jgi:hypothetical protein
MGLHTVSAGPGPFVVLAAVLALLPGAAGAAPRIPVPPEAKVEWVGRNMEVNGIVSDIRSFHTSQSLDKVSDFYRRRWERPVGKDLPGFTETDAMEPWRLFTRIEDGYIMTVQMQKADMGGTWGYLAISPLPDPKKPVVLGQGAPAMRDSQVLHEMKTDDPGKKGRTMVISNNYSVGSNIEYYRNHFRHHGWEIETDHALKPGVFHSLVFKSPRKRTTIMLIGDNQATRVVINEVTHAILGRTN